MSKINLNEIRVDDKGNIDPAGIYKLSPDLPADLCIKLENGENVKVPAKYRVRVSLDLTLEEMRKLPEGTVVGIPCEVCEGHEKHTKQSDGTWKCNCCGDVKELK